MNLRAKALRNTVGKIIILETQGRIKKSRAIGAIAHPPKKGLTSKSRRENRLKTKKVFNIFFPQKSRSKIYCS